MNAPFIKPNGCKNCQHRVVANGVAECHFGPPTAHPIVEKDAAGSIKITGTLSIFPNVQPDWICGQHKPIAVIARGASAASALLPFEQGPSFLGGGRI